MDPQSAEVENQEAKTSAEAAALPAPLTWEQEQAVKMQRASAKQLFEHFAAKKSPVNGLAETYFAGLQALFSTAFEELSKAAHHC